ncbi:MAG: heimdallarchaeosortase [Candidatus Hodarchaeales archaeon]|jgi:exosortase/archaeosortase family protein
MEEATAQLESDKSYQVTLPVHSKQQPLDEIEIKIETITQQERYKKDKLMISTLIIAVVITFLLYTVPDWVFIEIPTRDIIQFLLSLVGIESEPIRIGEFLNTPSWPILERKIIGGPFPFIEATVETPGLFLPSTNGQYWIVKACTGMQAGGLLLAIIVISEAAWSAKLRASVLFMLALFIGNSLRIAFHLWAVSFLYQNFTISAADAFFWAHDIPTKIIGFIGTIFFAFIIEKMGVPIIDQFADWLDWLWWRVSWLLPKSVRK